MDGGRRVSGVSMMVGDVRCSAMSLVENKESRR